jgi:hypothetical protein
MASITSDSLDQGRNLFGTHRGINYNFNWNVNRGRSTTQTLLKAYPTLIKDLRSLY